MPLKLKPDPIILKELGIQENGPIHKFFTETCARYADPYVPFRSGDLARYKTE